MFAALAIERNTYQLRFGERIACLQKGKSTVVITATHAESIATCIERKQWGYDNIKPLRVDGFSVSGLEYVVSIST